MTALNLGRIALHPKTYLIRHDSGECFEVEALTIARARKLYSGALTAPTATTLASAATPLASVRSLSVSCNNKIAGDRFNFGKNGRKDKPVVGIRDIAGQMSVEYADTAFRDAVLADTPMTLVATLEGGNLSEGKDTLQVVLPEIKIDNELPKANGVAADANVVAVGAVNAPEYSAAPAN